MNPDTRFAINVNKCRISLDMKINLCQDECDVMDERRFLIKYHYRKDFLALVVMHSSVSGSAAAIFLSFVNAKEVDFIVLANG